MRREGAVFDGEVVAELEELFGRTKLMDLLARLDHEIAGRLRPAARDTTQLSSDAHALVSVSGSLGFLPLSQACADLERACLRGGDLSAPLEAAVAAAEAATWAIADLRAA
ncbi:Hpt domain-containing protein [Methylobacterium organophilum]|uniref:HPt domain-containing protein n=1 Tax=Methylobacterium organophilum TaxID=410 RepID=A0ABQ4TE66_METOR|nr:Hpt domain-containing protein [Methylobacterium organophilum]GJE28405.1 hypothetical protein LKMONMHP_3276 [Methylobacterium organophilum]